MTAEAVSLEMTAEPPSLPDWVFPPPGGFVAEDLDRIPDLPAHTELIDGSLVFVSPQRDFHTSAIFLLQVGLFRVLPAGYRIRREMSVRLNEHQRPEPDISIIRAEAVHGRHQTFYEAADVLLVVEVVSPESKVRDYKRKPELYAEAGIPHFWCIEDQSHQTVVHVYELDPVTKAYGLAGIYRDRLKLSVPFDIDIDLTEIDKL